MACPSVHVWGDEREIPTYTCVSGAGRVNSLPPEEPGGLQPNPEGFCGHPEGCGELNDQKNVKSPKKEKTVLSSAEQQSLLLSLCTSPQTGSSFFPPHTVLCARAQLCVPARARARVGVRTTLTIASSINPSVVRACELQQKKRGKNLNWANDVCACTFQGGTHAHARAHRHSDTHARTRARTHARDVRCHHGLGGGETVRVIELTSKRLHSTSRTFSG